MTIEEENKDAAVEADPTAAPVPEETEASLDDTEIYNRRGRFFDRLDWSAFWISALMAFAVYFYSLPPSVTLEDSGELAVAAEHLGVPHPPGYPSWTMLNWVFVKAFSWVKYRGWDNPAWAVALCSAVCGAFAAACASMLLCKSGRHMLRYFDRRGTIPIPRQNIIALVGGVVSSLLFAYSPIMWSQSVIVEVYAFNALFLTGICLLLYVWMCRQEAKYLYYIGFLFGLGQTNYQVLLLFGAAIGLAVFLQNPRQALVFAGLSAIYLFTYFLIKNGTIATISHPTASGMWIYLGLNLGLLLLAYHFAPHGRTVALTLFLAQVGVAFYLYMPISSETNPPMNWGYPRTWEGFQHAIFRKQYEKISPASVLSPEFIPKIGVYLTDLRLTFKLPFVILGFLPFTAWVVKHEKRRFSVFSISLVCAAFAVLFAVLEYGFPSPDNVAHPLETMWRLFVAGILILLVLGAFIMGALALIRVFYRLFMPEEEKVATKGIPLQFVFGPTTQHWLLTLTVGFLVMSVLLVALANLKLDIQDYFIQRVKFISSHGLFVIFIGYGLILTIATIFKVCARFGERFKILKLVPAITIGAVMASPALPLLENANNDHLVRLAGGAEQTGHDFGWQFGYYQLRGRNGIQEEIELDEEPLPNPEYPPAMGTNAVFFGGTDPGRFVPTYMIFSAKVRSDVFLITQNALADGTYMSVMRDLYGDKIWIPSIPDSNKAFQSYLDDVRNGRRPASAEIKIDKGRVQVMGVGGVMIINGYLAKDIYDNNIQRHAFYVEESYVLDWMYPYLAPHGLIMEIRDNKGDASMPDHIIRNDIDFWDWYSQRLLSDPAFRRDIVARKSFSKLRSAIAGLYGWHSSRTGFRKFANEAEFAFQQSINLYPLSPEANFRFAELNVKQGKFAKAKKIMTRFQAEDPGNTKVQQFLKQLVNIEAMDGRKRELEKSVLGSDKKQVDINKALELAEIYLKTRNNGSFVNLTRQILNLPKLPAPIYLRVYHLAMRGKRVDEMNLALSKYLKLQPNDIQAIINMAAIKVIKRKHEEALPLIEKAIKLGGPQVAAAITKDQRFAELRPNPRFQQMLRGARPAQQMRMPQAQAPLTIPGLSRPRAQPQPGLPGALPKKNQPNRP